MTGFTYSSPDQLPFLKHSKYTADLPKYFYIDKYIYIYNNLDLGLDNAFDFIISIAIII